MKASKRVRILLGILLAMWGLLLGWLFASFVLEFYPGGPGPAWRTAIKLINAALFGIIFATLTRPVSALAVKAARRIKSALSSRPLYVTGSILLGMTIGVLFGILAAAVADAAGAATAVKLIVSPPVAAFGWYLGYLACRKWLSVSAEDEDDVHIEYCGYVFSYGAFFSPVCVAAAKLLNGRIYVTDLTARRLIESGGAGDDPAAEAALDRYMQIAECAAVRSAEAAEGESEEQAILRLAETRLLKIIVGTPDEIGTERESAKILALTELENVDKIHNGD